MKVICFFEKMTLEQAYNTDTMPLKNAHMGKMLMNTFLDVCRDLPENPLKLLYFLGKEDQLTRMFYDEYRQETLCEHAKIVAANLEDLSITDYDTVATLAILHDIGKKYAQSDLDYDPCACAAMSAYMASEWLKKQNHCEIFKKYLVATIYYQVKSDDQQRVLKELSAFFDGDCNKVRTTQFLINRLRESDVMPWLNSEPFKAGRGESLILSGSLKYNN